MIKAIYLAFILTLLGCSANQYSKNVAENNVTIIDSATNKADESNLLWGLDEIRCPKSKIKQVTIERSQDAKAIVTEKCLNVYFKIINLTKNTELQCQYIYGLKKQTRYVDPNEESEVQFERYIGNSEVVNPGFDYSCKIYKTYDHSKI